MTRQTSTLPSHSTPPPLAADPITGLRELGTGVVLALSPEASTFTLGANPACQLHLPRTYVSSVHAVIERRGHQRVRVADSASKNGIYFYTPSGPEKRPSDEVGAGDVFSLGGDAKLMAITEPMKLGQARFQFYLGYDAHAAVDAALLTAVTSSAVRILGEPKLEHRAVAELLHQCSPRRLRPFVEATTRDEIRAAFNGRPGAVFFDVARVDGLADDAELIAMLQRVEANGVVGLYIAAETERAAAASGVVLRRDVTLWPLRARSGDVPRMLDQLFVDANELFEAEDLGTENVAALVRYRWRDNLDELRAIARWLPHVAREGKSAASKRIGVDRSTMTRRTKELGLTFPVPAVKSLRAKKRR